MITDSNTTLYDRIDEIHGLLAENEVPRGIKRAMDFIKEFSKDKDTWNEIIVFSNQFHRINSELHRGITEYSYADQTRNKILFGVLALIDRVHSNYSSEIC